MALSYSNPNVEAGLFPTHLTLGEKPTRDDSSYKPSYNKLNSFFSLVQVVVNVVLFAAVIWLVFHVVYLEQEQVKTEGLIVNRKGYPTIGSSRNATNDSSTKNADFAGNARGRRQAPSISDTADYGAMPSSYSDYDQAPVHGMGHAFFHVVENSLRQVPVGEDRYFEFHTSTEARYSRWTHESLNFIENRFMEVTVPGYYHVYSQMQYSGYQINQVVGHEVVVLPDCSRGDTFVILKTTSHAGETGYTAGVFYLDVNDRVGVRPPGDSSNPITFGGRPSTSFFGAFLLYEDNYGKVRADLEPCP